MDKRILYDYIDACELVKETEEDIRSLKRKRTVQDKVKGSNPEFPYQPQGFNIEGTLEEDMSAMELAAERNLLQQRKENARRIRIEAEKVMNEAPIRMQRIIRYKIMKGLTWDRTAAKMGRNCTGDSVRMEFQNWIREK